MTHGCISNPCTICNAPKTDEVFVIKSPARDAIDRIVSDLRAEANQLRALDPHRWDVIANYLDLMAIRYEKGDHLLCQHL